jgi:hypothetical protein
MFMDEINKESVLQLFHRLQRHKYALNRFAYIYKRWKCPLHNTEDMYLNPIQETSKNTMVILQHGKKYLFTIKDIINIVTMAIGHCSNFFPNPQVIKNPYNNTPFSKSALYNMYFAIKQSNYIMPILFHCFFMTNFHFKHFMELYEDMIIEEHISKYVYSSNNINELYLKTKIMFHSYHSDIVIHQDYPKQLLIENIRPLLHYYLLSIYCASMTKINYYHEKWIESMYLFEKENPLFGRKIYKPNDTTFIHRKEIHIQDNFMNNHIMSE